MAYRTKPWVSYPASEPLEAYRLVTLLPAGQLAYNDAADNPLGVTQYPALEAEQLIGARLLNTEGTIEVETAGIVAAGDEVMAVDDGKVVTASGTGGLLIGQALAEAPVGGVVEVVPYGYHHILS